MASPSAYATVVRRLLLSLPVLLLFASCASNRYYNQRVLFRLTDEKGNRIDTAKLRVAVNRTDRNYRIQPNDFLDIRVYTNKGERIIDPNGELQLGSSGGQVPSLTPRITASPQGRAVPQISRTGTNGSGTGLELLVQANGMVAVPIIGLTHLSGLTLHQADSTLQVLFTPYYRDTFIQTRVTNNRVIILGSPGGVVVPLANDNMNLLEVLALAGGIDGNGGGGAGGLYRYGGKTSNVRIIRGDLKNPQIEQIDLSTIAGMRRANLQMEPNDIVYIEPVRRPFLEGLTDAGPVFSAAATLLGTVSIVFSLITIARQN
ncbi:polysaccharide biosynthesis/export family protein [Hymenobacter setariae]|uniref:polysaccharide biosynthesis/export family protein n=1 Tax=Hymenobacter setariae TaxID=2594794 RepID=UPI001F464205|nr:polysaccharide biosynthesis/export family protein [Hymenobacter setariae]